MSVCAFIWNSPAGRHRLALVTQLDQSSGTMAILSLRYMATAVEALGLIRLVSRGEKTIIPPRIGFISTGIITCLSALEVGMSTTLFASRSSMVADIVGQPLIVWTLTGTIEVNKAMAPGAHVVVAAQGLRHARPLTATGSIGKMTGTTGAALHTWAAL